jgi:allantoate deiminase
MSAEPTDPATAEAALILTRADELAAISSRADALERVHLSPEHARANALLAEWMTAAGLSTWQDAAGNQWGRLEGTTPGLPALILGSHIDTVPDAGRYDGMLGVLLAIQVASRIDEGELPFAVELVAFSDEEGTRFGTALLGSRAVAGAWDDSWFDRVDADGITVREAFETFGLDPRRVRDAARREDDVIGYLEAHIEQGPYLEDADLALGVVSSIAAAKRYRITVDGHAGHAGATPYDRRRDALVGAAEAVVGIERIARAGATIATVGRIEAFPGGVNVIPGRVEFTLDLRAETDDERDDAWRLIAELLTEITDRRRLNYRAIVDYRADAVTCAPSLSDAVAEGIAAVQPGAPISLWSKAGHDGMAIADLTEIGMLFVRCAGGVSHHPDEAVRADDVRAALLAYEIAVRSLAPKGRGTR